MEILEEEEISGIFKIIWQIKWDSLIIINSKVKIHQIQNLRQLSADISICMVHATMVINVHMHMEIMN